MNLIICLEVGYVLVTKSVCLFFYFFIAFFVCFFSMCQ